MLANSKGMKNMKTKVQAFGRFLSAMIMPNIGAFIALGLMAAILIVLQAEADGPDPGTRL